MATQLHKSLLKFVASQSRSASSLSMTRKQNRLPVSYYRGGTSRALIFNRDDLPAERRDWDEIFLKSIGGNDPNGRQLDGMGGGVSSLSKVCIVGRSTNPLADVDYTFAAIGVKDAEVDYSSNCGNMTSAIGPFAVDTGLIQADDGQTTVRICNTNSGKIIHASFPVEDGEAVADGDFAIDGVAGKGAKVELAFIEPAGSKTGKLLPTGNIVDEIQGVTVTCIDVGNPCVFVKASSLHVDGTILPDEIDSHPTLLRQLDKIRRHAAVGMGISATTEATPGSIPKIAVISPVIDHKILSGAVLKATNADVVIRALSVGQPHRAVPITVAMAVAAAAYMPGSTVADCTSESRVDATGLTIGHSSGKLMVNASFDKRGYVESATVFRTARRLMDGNVYWKP